jgi:hypothetical protein
MVDIFGKNKKILFFQTSPKKMIDPEGTFECCQCKKSLPPPELIAICCCEQNEIWCMDCAKEYVFVLAREDRLTPPHTFCSLCKHKTLAPLYKNCEEVLKIEHEETKTSTLLLNVLMKYNMAAVEEMLNNERKERAKVCDWEPKTYKNALKIDEIPEPIEATRLEIYNLLQAYRWPFSFSKLAFFCSSILATKYASKPPPAPAPSQIEEQK